MEEKLYDFNELARETIISIIKNEKIECIKSETDIIFTCDRILNSSFEFQTFDDLINNIKFEAYYKNLNKDNQILVKKYVELYEYLPSNFIRGYRSNIKLFRTKILILLLCYERISYNVYDAINGKSYFSAYEVHYTNQLIRINIAVLLNSNDNTMLNLIKKMVYDNENGLSLSQDVIIGIIMSNNKEAIKCLFNHLKVTELPEKLISSILDWADYGSNETFKQFLQIIRDENLIRFPSVKKSFSHYTGLYDYIIDSQNYENHSEYIFECILNNKTEEFLESDNALKTYIALYTLATTDFDEVVKYINENIDTSKNYKKGAMLYFLDKARQKIDSKIIVEVLESEIPENIKNTFLHYNVKFKSEVDKRRYIEVVLKYLVSLKSNATYSFLYDNKLQIVRKEVLYENILKLVYETNYYYEEAYSYFEKYVVRLFEWDGINAREYFNKIYHPAQKAAYLRGLGSNIEKTRTNSFKIIDSLKLKLSDDEYLELAKLFNSKRSDIRINLCELFKDAEAETIIKCSKYLLEQKNDDLKSGGLSILADNIDKLKNISSFEEIKEIVRNTEFSYEYEVLRNAILEQEEIKEENLNEIVYNVPTLKYDMNLVNKIAKFDTEKIERLMKDLYRIFEAHRGEEVESTNYDESKTVYVVGTNLWCILNLNNAKRDGEIIFQDEFFNVLKEFSYEEAWLLQINYGVINSLINLRPFVHYLSKFDNSEMGKYFMENECLPGITQNPEIYVQKNREYPTTESEQMCYIFEKVLQAYIRQLEKKYDIKKQKIEFNEIVFNWYAFALEKIKSEIDNLPSCFYHKTRKSIRDKLTISNIINTQFIVRSPFYDEILFDKNYASDVLKNFLFLNKNKYAPANISDIRYIELIGYGIDEEFVINKFIDPDFIVYGSMNNQPQVVSLSRTLAGWNKFGKQQIVDKDICERVYNRCIEKMLEVEFKRTDSETKYSRILSDCRVFYGTRTFMRAIDKMKKIDFLCVYSWGSAVGIKDIFSRIVRLTKIEDDLTIEQFSELVKEYKISDKKLLEACMYNKDFIDMGSKYLNINGLHKAIYYFIAHGLSSTAGIDEELKRNIRRYSEFELEDFVDGKMDVKWFNEVKSELSAEDFKKVYDASKYIMDTSKRKRAQYFADAVAGNLDIKEVLDKINDKRNQDMLLCYGLIPLGKNKDKEALVRYKRLQQFIKESKQFGAQRRATERKRADIAIANLATSYGKEINSFVWLMEVKIVNQIKDVFVPKKIDDIEIYLSIANPSKPELVITKEDKILKSLPAKYKKDEYIIQLNEVKVELKNQYTRAKKTLEQNMVDSEVFDFEEVAIINTHPVIKEIIKDILFIEDGFIGMLEDDKLVNYLGEEKKLSLNSKLRIAHSIDLLDNNWDKWQIYIMEKEIKQPFKQVFREVYTLTEDEIKNDGYTNRFAGYQISGKQALGVLSSRNWIINENEGFEKINHAHNLRIDLYCYANWFNANDIEEETLEKVVFLDNKTNKTKDMKSLDKILFSETMRDLDLVVSVAYIGGVDPLLNHTTIEMRKRILEHNLKLFKLNNYAFTDNHINITGEFGTYVIHLGSGIVSMQGKGMLPVFPVHSQQRGHIFLPFVDEDPKTAEIVTKVLMFAKDIEIKDPSILKYLR